MNEGIQKVKCYKINNFQIWMYKFSLHTNLKREGNYKLLVFQWRQDLDISSLCFLTSSCVGYVRTHFF